MSHFFQTLNNMRTHTPSYIIANIGFFMTYPIQVQIQTGIRVQVVSTHVLISALNWHLLGFFLADSRRRRLGGVASWNFAGGIGGRIWSSAGTKSGCSSSSIPVGWIILFRRFTWLCQLVPVIKGVHFVRPLVQSCYDGSSLPYLPS